MAKTKYQKQQEAIERKRKFFHVYVTLWIDSQPGGEKYKRQLAFGKEAADKCAAEAERALVKAAKEANVDRYGNPL